MNILIADDAPHRYEELIKRLRDHGICRDSVSIVTSAHEARERLKTQRFDLLLIDILLPMRPEDNEFDTSHSLDLLTELHEFKTLLRPERIIGITGDPTVLAEYQADFVERTWVLIEYSPQQSEWIGCILNCVDYIQNRTLTPPRSVKREVDLCVLCALRDPELEEFLKIKWNWEPAEPFFGVYFAHRGSFCVDGEEFTVAISHAPKMGMVSTALLCAAAIENFNPRVIMLAGICAGVPRKTKLGDIVFCDPVWDYHEGKVISVGGNPSLEIAPEQLRADPLLRSFAEQLGNDPSEMSAFSARCKWICRRIYC